MVINKKVVDSGLKFLDQFCFRAAGRPGRNFYATSDQINCPLIAQRLLEAMPNKGFITQRISLCSQVMSFSSTRNRVHIPPILDCFVL